MPGIYKNFDQEYEALKKKVGEANAVKTLQILSEVIYWLRTFGHGNVTLSAIDHQFSPKFRGDTIFSVKDRKSIA
jgi:hypothetical protein